MQVEALMQFKVNEAVIQTSVDALNIMKKDLVQFTLEQKERHDPSWNKDLIEYVKTCCIRMKDKISKCRSENQVVLEVLDQLTEKHRTILTLFYIKGMTRKECAEVMQFSVQYIPELKRIALKEFERR